MQFGASSNRYTSKYRTIDDLNEICEILQESQKEYVRQKNAGKFGRTFGEVEKYNKDILKRTTNPSYKGFTLD